MIPAEASTFGIDDAIKEMSSRSAIPAEVKIFGVDYTVDEVEIVDRENYACVGWCDPRKATITVCRDLNDKIKQQTLIHEVIHAILESLSLHEESANEVLVQGLAAGINEAFGKRIFLDDKEVEQ